MVSGKKTSASIKILILAESLPSALELRLGVTLHVAVHHLLYQVLEPSFRNPF
jgi:hypothetical protein